MVRCRRGRYLLDRKSAEIRRRQRAAVYLTLACGCRERSDKHVYRSYDSGYRPVRLWSMKVVVTIGAPAWLGLPRMCHAVDVRHVAANGLNPASAPES
jgi:hypothetical protein